MSNYRTIEENTGLTFSIARENSFNKIQAYNNVFDIQYSTDIDSIKNLKNASKILFSVRMTCKFTDNFKDLILSFDILEKEISQHYDIYLELEPNLFDLFVDYGYTFNRNMIKHADEDEVDEDEDNKQITKHILNILYRQHCEITELKLSKYVEDKKRAVIPLS